jgi:hypothetical protein
LGLRKVLVEAQALEQAEEECLADADARARRREREAARRTELDREYVQRFAARVRELYPRCPPGREVEIAEHACLKYWTLAKITLTTRKIGRLAAFSGRAQTDWAPSTFRDQSRRTGAGYQRRLGWCSVQA